MPSEGAAGLGGVHVKVADVHIYMSLRDSVCRQLMETGRGTETNCRLGGLCDAARVSYSQQHMYKPAVWQPEVCVTSPPFLCVPLLPPVETVHVACGLRDHLSPRNNI